MHRKPFQQTLIRYKIDKPRLFLYKRLAFSLFISYSFDLTLNFNTLENKYLHDKL